MHTYQKKRNHPKTSLLFLHIIVLTNYCYAQTNKNDSLLQQASLPNVIQYALQHQPTVQQALIDEKTTDLDIKSQLSAWYPQVNFNYLLQHNFEVQTNIIDGVAQDAGLKNTSAFQFGATQNIFNRDVLLAYRTKGDVRRQSRQQTASTKIDVVVNVSKAFYDLLSTVEQIKVENEDIIRLQRSLKDARAQYEAGIVDKTDYKRATISLNNAIATLKTDEENLKVKTDFLKELMNYPASGTLNIVYDSAALVNEINLDTLRTVDYSRRIEYKQLETQRRLQVAELKYNKWSFIPSVSADGAYNFNYQDNEFNKLYSTSFPNSYIGLTAAFPIFQGGKRRYNIRIAEWQLKRTDLDFVALENTVNTEYTTALASYKSSLANFLALKENVLLAQEVYDVIRLQYRNGIKTYLEVITAETDLRTAQINYFDSLYGVLSSKIDVQRSLGDISF